MCNLVQRICVKTTSMDILGKYNTCLVNTCLFTFDMAFKPKVEPASDVFGCTSIKDGELVASKDWEPLEDSTPTLIILQMLLDQGWDSGHRVEPHKPDDNLLLFSAIALQSNKRYLQCLLMIKDLFSNGLGALHVQQLQSYYRVAMKSSDLSQLQPGLKAIEYVDMLKGKNEALEDDDESHGPLPIEDDDSSDNEPLLQLAVVRAVPKARATTGKRKRSNKQDESQIDVLSGLLWRRTGASTAAQAALCDIDKSVIVNIAPSGSASLSSSSLGPSQSASASGASSSSSVYIPPENIPVVAEANYDSDDEKPVSNLSSHPDEHLGIIEGVPCTYDSFGVKGNPNYYERLTVKCPLRLTSHKHQRACQKKRNTGKTQTTPYGPLQPMAYLGVWLREGCNFPNKLAHQAYEPTLSEVEAYMRHQGWL